MLDVITSLKLMAHEANDDNGRSNGKINFTVCDSVVYEGAATGVKVLWN